MGGCISRIELCHAQEILFRALWIFHVPRQKTQGSQGCPIVVIELQDFFEGFSSDIFLAEFPQ